MARGRELPELEPGDLVALYDTGAYYFSTHFHYNSLPRPAVYGYVRTENGTEAGKVEFAPIRSAQTLDEVLAESGAQYAGSLLGLPAGPSVGLVD